MYRRIEPDKTYILLPYIKNKYKVIEIVSGNVNIYKQPNEERQKIDNIYIIQNDRKHLFSRIENRELIFFVTSKCNQRCIMCPQLLNIDSSDNDLILKRIVENLDYRLFDSICFTGGEPLLKESIIEQVVSTSPKNVLITILTNGTIIPSEKILKSDRVKLCIPLYAPNDEIHNYMTGSFSFYNVVENLMRISYFGTLIELRFVVTRINYSFIPEYARFVWRNLPFVQDVAFMGIELTAEAKKNKDELWCNPKDYITYLQTAIDFLDSFGVTVWVYNLPSCLFEKRYRKFLVKSISNWKIKYLKKCDSCELKPVCGGMFFSDVSEFEKILES